MSDSLGDTFLINYADNGDGGVLGNDISLTCLTVVPEPSTWAVGALALSAIIWRRRKRLRAFAAFSKTHLICRNWTNNYVKPSRREHATES